MSVKTVFLIGPPRTGTTLLNYLLAGGENSIGLSEPYLTHAINPPYRLHRALYRFQIQAGPHRVPVPWECGPVRFFNFFKRVAEANDIKTLVVKETFRGGNLGPKWVNVEQMNRLATGPDGVIGIIRHPCDAVASSIRLARWALGWRRWVMLPVCRVMPKLKDRTDIVRWAAENWVRFTQWARDHNVHVVRYEDLCNDAAGVIRDLCPRIGLAFDKNMVDTAAPRRAFWGVGAPEVMMGKPRPVDKSSVGRGKNLSSEHIQIVKDITGGCAGDYDYEL